MVDQNEYLLRLIIYKEGLINMKNFSWNYFSLSGKVESYLLYKDLTISDVSQGEANAHDAYEAATEI